MIIMISAILRRAYAVAGFYIRRIRSCFSYYSSAELRKFFVDYMNVRARELGATSSFFSDASGYLSDTSKTSALDMLHILVYAVGLRHITEVWNRQEYLMRIDGPNKRTVTVNSTLNDFRLKDKGSFLGGKTGTVPELSYNLMWCSRMPDQSVFACVLIGASDAPSRLEDYSLIQKSITERDFSIINNANSKALAGCIIPSFQYISGNQDMNLVISKKEDMAGIPASLTKVMSLICACDYIHDFHTRVRIKKSDICKGSGNNLRKGDRVTIQDLFHDMLLSSSNTASNALARYVGREIIKSL